MVKSGSVGTMASLAQVIRIFMTDVELWFLDERLIF
jgi:hypothetical protein